MTAALALIRSPRSGAAAVLREGSLGRATLLILGATVLSVLHTARFASEVSVQDVMFGERQSPLVGTLLSTLGVELTAIVLYLVESAWSALLAVSALAPVLLWLLGASAIHAAARMAGVRRPFLPTLVVVGYATAVTRPLADVPGIVIGPRAAEGLAGAVVQLLGAAAIVWLAILAYHAIRAHYGVPGERAVTILAVALVLFYLVPFTLILVAVIAILVAAIVLEYVPAR